MNVVLTTEDNGDLTPESRAAVISEVFCFMSTKMERVPYATILRHVMSQFSCSEQLVAIHVMKSVDLLITSGLLSTNTYFRDEDEEISWFEIREDTLVGPSKRMTEILYGEVA